MNFRIRLELLWLGGDFDAHGAGGALDCIDG